MASRDKSRAQQRRDAERKERRQAKKASAGARRASNSDVRGQHRAAHPGYHSDSNSDERRAIDAARQRRITYEDDVGDGSLSRSEDESGSETPFSLMSTGTYSTADVVSMIVLVVERASWRVMSTVSLYP